MKPYTIEQVKFKIKEVGTYTGTGSGSLIEKYAKNAQAVILAYKRADTETFDELKKAMEEVNKYFSKVFKVVLVDNYKRSIVCFSFYLYAIILIVRSEVYEC